MAGVPCPVAFIVGIRPSLTFPTTVTEGYKVNDKAGEHFYHGNHTIMGLMAPLLSWTINRDRYVQHTFIIGPA